MSLPVFFLRPSWIIQSKNPSVCNVGVQLDEQQQWPIVGCWNLRRVMIFLIPCGGITVGAWHGVLELKQAFMVAGRDREQQKIGYI